VTGTTTGTYDLMRDTEIYDCWNAAGVEVVLTKLRGGVGVGLGWGGCFVVSGDLDVPPPMKAHDVCT
jgi:hypothetical protein